MDSLRQSPVRNHPCHRRRPCANVERLRGHRQSWRPPVDGWRPSLAWSRWGRARVARSSFTRDRPDLTFDDLRRDLGAGIYKSTNGGVNWRALLLVLGDLGVHALVVDPREPKTVYAGTDHVGVLKTTDGGARWTEVNAGIRPGAGRRRLAVDSLAIDPRSPKTIYAATRLGDDASLFKTTDGAASWRELKRGQLGAWEVAVDPRSSATVYAFFRGQFFKSTTEARPGLLPSCQEGSHLRLQSTRAPRTFTSACMTGAYVGGRRPSSAVVYRSVDRGRTWQPFARGLEVPAAASPAHCRRL